MPSSGLAACSLFITLQLLSIQATAQERVSCSSAQQVTTCRITEPNVGQRLTAYPQITFQPRDSVLVQAGGCVQTGGHGKTWKRYVNPSGPNSDRLYHGLIQLPGVQSDLVRIAGVIDRPISIPSNMNSQNAFLRLGYEDDGYGDNGYWGHDDGTEDQCKNVGNAFVTLTITHNAPQTLGAAPFDLVFSETDTNDFPLNPEWAWQRDHAGALPDADTQCFTFPNNFSNPACTTQSPSIDEPEGWNATWCAAGANHSIHGHVNWMPSTWQGSIAWDGHSSPGTDDDYNINLTPPNAQGLTVSSDGTIHSEFDSDETIDHFHTPWWEAFHSAVDNGDANARAMIDGKTAIVTGLVGLDCEHGCATEMHPVYALAIHVNSDPQDDTWAIFARNWGDEGYCSQYQHLLDSTRIAFLIPHPAASGVQLNVATTFLTNNSQVAGPGLSLVPGQGAIVEFSLPPPEAGARLNGELHLQWSTSAAGSPAARAAEELDRSAAARAAIASRRPPVGTPAAAVAAGAGQLESEKRLDSVIERLPPDRRAAMNVALKRVRTLDTLKARPLGTTSAKPIRPARIRVVTDAVKSERDLQRAKAICSAHGGNVPGLSVNPCAQLSH